MKALSAAKLCEYCTIKWLFGIPEVLEIMKSYHIGEGSRIQVLQCGKDRLIIKTEDTKLAMSTEIAQRIKV